MTKNNIHGADLKFDFASTDMSKPLSSHEVVMLYSLMIFIADTKKTSTEAIQEILVDEFGINELAQLQKLYFGDAVRFLANLCANQAIH